MNVGSTAHPKTAGSFPPPAPLPLRPPENVMRLDRMGSAFPTRLSFMPTLLRRLARENWTIALTCDDLDAEGYGCRVYRAKGPERVYSLVAFSQRLAPEFRNDRVIAEAWDATFALFDGEPSEADMQRLAANVPLQEAGRFLPSELVLSRANRSVRMFDHVVSRLAAGKQPDPDLMMRTGYLMRTTAVYGNGKFGIADRCLYEDRPELAGPFQAEFLAVYLIRCFTLDLVEHIARGPCSVRLAPEFRRYFGIGNSTGLGMAPFLVNHPALISRWVEARETALGRVRARKEADGSRIARFGSLLARARAHVAQWRIEDPVESARIEVMAEELEALAAWVDGRKAGPDFWEALHRHGGRYSLPTQELLVSLMLQPHGDVVDDLADEMSQTSLPAPDFAMPVGDLRAIARRRYGWASRIDFRRPEALQQFWYTSQEKQEPRIGNRYEEPGAEHEMPFAIARDVQALLDALEALPDATPVASLLLAHPELVHTAHRLQLVDRHVYGEIRDNLVGVSCRPLDLLRCKLAFFGAVKFDPKSDKWLRISLYQGAPMPEDLADPDPAAEDWIYSVLRPA